MGVLTARVGEGMSLMAMTVDFRISSDLAVDTSLGH